MITNERATEIHRYSQRLRPFALGRADQFYRADGAVLRHIGDSVELTHPDGRKMVAEFSLVSQFLLDVANADDEIARQMITYCQYLANLN